MFDSAEARDAFRMGKRSELSAKDEGAQKVDSIPIIPLYSKPALGSAVLESILPRSAEVVGIMWAGGRIERTEYSVRFEDYWRAVGSSRFRAGTIYVFDLAGIDRAEPSFQTMRELAKCDCRILLDLGASSPEDIMDGFMNDVEKVIASTKSLKGPQDFEGIFALTEDCIPCIDWEDGVVWAGGNRREPLEPLAKKLSEIGYESLAVMDLARLGRLSGPSPELAAACSSLDLSTYLGGGIKEEDVPLLLDKGISTALLDPYTPMIRDILLRKTTEPKPTEAVAPEKAPATDVRPTSA